MQAIMLTMRGRTHLVAQSIRQHFDQTAGISPHRCGDKRMRLEEVLDGHLVLQNIGQNGHSRRNGFDRVVTQPHLSYGRGQPCCCQAHRQHAAREAAVKDPRVKPKGVGCHGPNPFSVLPYVNLINLHILPICHGLLYGSDKYFYSFALQALKGASDNCLVACTFTCRPNCLPSYFGLSDLIPAMSPSRMFAW